NTCADSIPTSCPECSTAPTSRPANDSSPPSTCPRPRPCAPTSRRPSNSKTAIAARLTETAREAGATNPEQLGEQLALLLDGASARTRVINSESFPTAAAIAAVLIHNH